MAFFPRNFYQPSKADNTSFTPLFRLLDDFDNYSRQCNPGNSGSRRRSTPTPTWQPKFDIRETGEAFQLHGELPGVNKENVHIEFTDPQTMLVRGRSERKYTAGTSPHAAAEPASPTTENPQEAPKSPTQSLQATVEDDEEDDAHSIGSGFEEVSKKPEEPKEVEQPKQPVDQAKYWLSERSIGEFTRTFNFPSRIDQDNVTANFTDGILTVVVPKAKKHEVRRIAVL